MIAYYLYGRGKDGYVSYNPCYTKTEEEHYFSKMTDYAGKFEDSQPEKYFYYRIRTQEKRSCSIIGKTVPVKTCTSILSGSRDTVFSFQYLLSGKEEKELLENPAHLYEYDCFPDNMDQVHRTREGDADITLDNAVLDLDYFFTREKGKEDKREIYSITELLDSFQMDENKLQDLIYTLLLFNTEEKVYVLLPDNTKKATDQAVALMCKLLSVLPAVMTGKTGFVTYVNETEGDKSDYVPYEIRYMFLANTDENRKACRTTKSAYVFCPGCETNIVIPEAMRGIVVHLTDLLVSGEMDLELQDLWGAMNKYLRSNEIFPVSTVEYCALNDFCKICRMIESGNHISADALVKNIWSNIDVLRSMTARRTELWNESLKIDLENHVQNVIDSDYVEEENRYKRIIAEYRADNGLHQCIENFFFRKVNDPALLEKYITLLEICPELKKKVYDHFIDVLEELLDSGKLDQSLYGTVLETYRDHPELQKKIKIFFENQITDEASYVSVKKIITTSTVRCQVNLELWNQIEKALYCNIEQNIFIFDMETKKIRQIFTDNSANVEKMFQSFWECIQRLYERNKLVLCDQKYFAEVKNASALVVTKWIQPSVMKEILIEAQKQIIQYHMPEEYRKWFADISERYLENYKSEICLSCDNLDLFNDWPLIDKGNKDILQIRKNLQQKKAEKDNIAQFEVLVESGSVKDIHHFIVSKKNAEVMETVSKSELAERYIADILKKLEKESNLLDRNNLAKDYYDELCVQLVLKFPDQMNQIFHYVMRSRYGGICAMSNIDALMNRKGRINRFLEDSIYEIRQSMAQEIVTFFEHYKMSRSDKKSIKAEKKYLQEIGIFYKELLKK